jgi:hypothetical protein
MFDSGWAAVVEEHADPSVLPSESLCWSQWVPGSELAAGLEGSPAVDLGDDGGFDAVERLAGWEKLANWATGRLYRETAHYLQASQSRARGAGRAELAFEAVAMEVATVARVAPRTGEIRTQQAETLVENLPRTLDALEAGRISLSHARVVIEQTEDCDPALARAVDEELWSRPERDRTPTQLREVVRRIIIRLDARGLRRRREAAGKKRGMRYWSDDHGATGVIQLRLPADEARGVFSVIDAVARSAGDDPDGPKRDMEQKRGDATRDLILDGATAYGEHCPGPCCQDNNPTQPETTGNATANDATANDATANDATANDATGDDATGESATANDATADDATSEGATSEGATSEGATSEGATSEGASGEGATDGENIAGSDGPSDDADSSDTTGGDPTGSDTTGSDTTGSDTTESTRQAGATGDGPGSAEPGSAAVSEARDPVRGLRRGARSPVRTEVRVTIGWDVLAGLSQRPGELEGHGPIPAELARRLAAGPDAWWQRLFTDPVTGTADHLDAHRYRPPAAMAELVYARDLTCAAPGCRVPAARCDLDHVTPYEHHHRGGGAGPTRADHLKPGCRRHHQLKTHRHWTTRLGPDPDGGHTQVIIWTSPSGHRWYVRPPELEPPWHDRDWHPHTHDHPHTDHPDTDEPDPPAPENQDTSRTGLHWPRDIDSWRRRETDPPPGDPWKRRAV